MSDPILAVYRVEVACSNRGMHFRYCQRVSKPSFWGGESELYIISRMLRTPINIYKTSAEVGIRYVTGAHIHSPEDTTVLS